MFTPLCAIGVDVTVGKTEDGSLDGHKGSFCLISPCEGVRTFGSLTSQGIFMVDYISPSGRTPSYEIVV
jgi:hypothetical protein